MIKKTLALWAIAIPLLLIAKKAQSLGEDWTAFALAITAMLTVLIYYVDRAIVLFTNRNKNQEEK